MSDVSPRFFVLTDLLLGAAYADDRLEGEEEDAVRTYLLEIIGGDELPIEVEARVANFEPEDFELEEVAAAFEDDPATGKRVLLELVAAVFDADGEVDFAEDDYLRHLANALGMEASEYEDLVIEYDIEEPGPPANALVAVPPPVPSD